MDNVCTSQEAHYISATIEEDDVVGTCDTNGREEERLYVIGRKARRKETTRKTET
jgi:hypothetical protein